jgi:hypothetical protein
VGHPRDAGEAGNGGALGSQGIDGVNRRGSPDCYLGGFSDEPLLSLTAPWDLIGAFPLSEGWLLLHVLGALRVHPGSGAVLAEYGHYDVWFFEGWTEQGVVFRDWEQAEVVLNPHTLERLA